MNHVCLIGRLGADPEIRYSNEGKTIASFSIALNEVYTDSQGQKQEHTSWIRCVAFNRTADVIGEYLEKGSRVGVVGSLRQRSFENEGQSRSVIEVFVRNIDFLSGGNGNGGGQEKSGPPEEDEDIPF